MAIPKQWENLPSTSTPISAQALMDLERRVSYAACPPGTVLATMLAEAPEGFLMALGQHLAKSEYPELWELLPDAWEVDWATFRLPNMQQKVPVGQQAGSPHFGTLGGEGGQTEVQLAEGHLPSHVHGSGTLGAISVPGHTHAVSGTAHAVAAHSHRLRVADIGVAVSGPTTPVARPWGYVGNPAWVEDGGGHSHSVSGSAATAGGHGHSINGSTAPAGSGQAHMNLQPYVVLNFMVRY